MSSFDCWVVVVELPKKLGFEALKLEDEPNIYNKNNIKTNNHGEGTDQN